MKFLTLTAALLFSAQAFAGEDVTVTWVTPDLTELPYDHYTLFYTDSTGAQFQVQIDDVTSTSHIVPDVEYGDSQWWMTSTCLVCAVTESESSAVIDFPVKEKGTPVAPSSVVIN